MGFFDCRNMTMRAVDECPFCHSHNIKKNGKEHHHQRWYCKECHRSFSSRTGTVLNSSKLKPVQIKRMVSMLSDGVLFHQVAHQIGVSVQTVCLWKRKLQALVKSQENSVLSGKVYADHTYISVPMKERSKKRRRGCPKTSDRLPLPSMTAERFLLFLEEKEMPVAETLKRRLLPMFHRIPLLSMTRGILAVHSVNRLKWL